MTREPIVRRLAQEYVVFLLVAMLIAIPVLSPFTLGDTGRALRYGLFESIGALLLVVLLARVRFRGGARRLAYVAVSGVNAPLLAFLAWSCLAALRAPDLPFAVGELLRLGCGALVYFAVALHLENRSQLRLLLDCVLGIVILTVGYGLFFPRGAGEGIAGLLPSRHHLSAILTVLFPLLVSLAWCGEELPRRLGATVAAVLAAVGLMLTLERSAGIATMAGLLVLGVSMHSRPRVGSDRPGRVREPQDALRPRDRRYSLLMTAGAFVLFLGFLAVTDLTRPLMKRAGQIPAAIRGRDESFAWRVQKWRGAARMTLERPLLGWGPGQFVLYQDRYTGLGSSRDIVRRYGASFDEMAYNDYLQTAAELGVPGLLLFLVVLASFFAKALDALNRLPAGFRRACLAGSVAGVGAQIVDASANGSWRYAECSIFFWLVLGIGIAVVRMASRKGGEAIDSSEMTKRKEL